jgi:hypothetical protein
LNLAQGDNGRFAVTVTCDVDDLLTARRIKV